MAVNWQLGVAPDIIGNALNAFEQGKTQRRQDTARNALGTLVQNPGDKAAFGTLASNDPTTALQFQKLQQEGAAEQAKVRAQHVQVLGRLLDYAKDEPTYQQSLQLAKQNGIDVSSAPPQYDPHWIEQQKMVVQAFAKDDGAALSNYGKIATDMGLRPGTPEFNAKVLEFYKADQVKTIPYTQGGGVAGYNPVSGEVVPIIQPNDGSHPVGAPATHSADVTTKTINGTTYYNVGGKWFDHNPAGGGVSNDTGGFQG